MFLSSYGSEEIMSYIIHTYSQHEKKEQRTYLTWRLFSAYHHKISLILGTKMNHWGKLVQSQILRNTRQTLWKSQERQETLITCARINYKAGIFEYIRGVPSSTHASGAHGTKTIWANVV